MVVLEIFIELPLEMCVPRLRDLFCFIFIFNPQNHSDCTAINHTSHNRLVIGYSSNDWRLPCVLSTSGWWIPLWAYRCRSTQNSLEVKSFLHVRGIRCLSVAPPSATVVAYSNHRIVAAARGGRRRLAPAAILPYREFQVKWWATNSRIVWVNFIVVRVLFFSFFSV